MGGSSKPRSPLYHTVREERLVLRYTVEDPLTGQTVRLNERSRLALWLLSNEFRAERVRGYTSGDLAYTLGDGNGWNAYPTAMALMRRGWAANGTAGMGHQQAFRHTDAGMLVLFELDKQWREREACRTCRGESKVRVEYAFSDLHVALLCPGCAGTLLVRRAGE